MEYQSHRAFPVEYVILGLLLDGPLHGYDLHQRMESALGPVWHVALSQLYNVLHRSARSGRIVCHEEPQEGSPPRRVCEATPEGRRAFLAWARSPVRHLRDLRVEFIAKVYLLRRAAPEELPALFDAQSALFRRILDGLARQDRIALDDPAVGRVVLAFRRQQLTSAIAWLEESRERLLESKEEA